MTDDAEGLKFLSAFQGKRVLITGHTGFKGAWLSEWLVSLGAELSGFSLPDPPTVPSLFEQLELRGRMKHFSGDIRDSEAIHNLVERLRPDYVFHLAAQPLVRLSYEKPSETYSTNIMGTVNVLEALRRLESPCIGIMVTSDKCYENREWAYSYREDDPMGGHDPYSSSKGAAELVIAGYRRSYFNGAKSLVRIASVRAGNVIGGGDWAKDRIIPDCIRGLVAGAPIAVRNKTATRPWQHVLEPLSGYLTLAAQMGEYATLGRNLHLDSAFNFGPKADSNRTVLKLVEEVLRNWPGTLEDRSDPNAVHEANFLKLATDKAYHLLEWRPVWDFETTVAETVKWYRRFTSGDIRELTQHQIMLYQKAARICKSSSAI
jgi:CDP-glucose 4,6-dehydratase